MEDTYTLTEHVENDGYYRKRGESGNEFDVADICEAREREVLEEDCRQVSCHDEEGGNKPSQIRGV